MPQRATELKGLLVNTLWNTPTGPKKPFTFNKAFLSTVLLVCRCAMVWSDSMSKVLEDVLYRARPNRHISGLQGVQHHPCYQIRPSYNNICMPEMATNNTYVEVSLLESSGTSRTNKKHRDLALVCVITYAHTRSGPHCGVSAGLPKHYASPPLKHSAKAC